MTDAGAPIFSTEYAIRRELVPRKYDLTPFQELVSDDVFGLAASLPAREETGEEWSKGFRV